MTISNYIEQLLSYEEYAFSWEELLEHCEKSEISLKRELSRLVEKKEVINLRRGFYLIIPPRYSKQGKLPIQLYIDKLFKYLNRYYYLGFYSAAKFHGASHQQTHRDYVMIGAPSIRNIKKDLIDIRFFKTMNWPNKNIVNKKSDAGIFKISSPALTAVDLIHHQTKLGGFNRMFAILEELSEEITKNDLVELLTWYSHKSTLQRLGFILELVEVDKTLTKLLKEHLKKSNYYPVLLSPRSSEKPGSVNNIWKVDVNIKLESDL